MKAEKRRLPIALLLLRPLVAGGDEALYSGGAVEARISRTRKDDYALPFRNVSHLIRGNIVNSNTNDGNALIMTIITGHGRVVVC